MTKTIFFSLLFFFFFFYQTNLSRSNCHRQRFRKLTFGAFAPHIVSIHSDERLMVETLTFQIFHGSNSTFINSFDKTKLLQTSSAAELRTLSG